jgi:hypothetical protein
MPVVSTLQLCDIGLRAALFDKFGDILDLPNVNQGVVYYPKDIAFDRLAEKKGTTQTEFISVWRTVTGPFEWSRQRTSIARTGVPVGYDDDAAKNSITRIKAVPTNLTYEITFWTKEVENLNLLAERFLFWQQDDPNLSLNYDDIYPLEFDLHFGSINDESPYSSIRTVGTHYRLSASMKLDGWVFVSSEVKTVHTIILTFYDRNNLEESDFSEIIVADSNQNVELEAILRLFRKTYDLTA